MSPQRRNPGKRPERYGIAEWYGRVFTALSAAERQDFAATPEKGNRPPCPFQAGKPPCTKAGGVCSIQRYRKTGHDRIGEAVGEPVITCPKRFDEESLLVRWLAKIAQLAPRTIKVAREVSFMHGTSTDKPAGKIDLVVAGNSDNQFKWYALEIQAVYVSGKAMGTYFQSLLNDDFAAPPFPDAIRRPDWRSSSAKRLMPQLQIKVPTIRRWGSKIAVTVDRPFFKAIGGPSDEPKQDLGDGDIIWLVPKLHRIGNRFKLLRDHWEILTLEDSSDKLLASETISQQQFVKVLRSKLEPLAPRSAT